MPFVLDNSVVIGWCFQSQATEYTDRVLDKLSEETAHVPGLWVMEFSNILRKALKADRIDNARAKELMAIVGGLPISVDAATCSVEENFELATRYGLSSYDAAYLELALRLNLPIASSDGALRSAAVRAGVGLV